MLKNIILRIRKTAELANSSTGKTCNKPAITRTFPQEPLYTSSARFAKYFFTKSLSMASCFMVSVLINYSVNQ